MVLIHLTGEGSLSASRLRMVAPGQAADGKPGKPDSGSIIGEAVDRNRSLRETLSTCLDLESELSNACWTWVLSLKCSLGNLLPVSALHPIIQQRWALKRARRDFGLNQSIIQLHIKLKRLPKPQTQPSVMELKCITHPGAQLKHAGLIYLQQPHETLQLHHQLPPALLQCWHAPLQLIFPVSVADWENLRRVVGVECTNM